MTHALHTHPSPTAAAPVDPLRPWRSRIRPGRPGAAALSVGRFVLHFVEMWLAMLAGMVIFMAVPGVMALPVFLHQLGMAISMTVPMVAWMRIRGHGWRHGVEMAAGMLVPWAAVLSLVALGAANVLPWLANAADAAMLLGMLGVMLLRPHHYAHGSHHHHAGRRSDGPSASSDQGTTDPVCGMTLDPRTATRTTEYQGQTYSFCAPGCRKTFLADPQKVLAPEYTPAM